MLSEENVLAELQRWGGMLDVEFLVRELDHPPKAQLEQLLEKMERLDLIESSGMGSTRVLMHVPARIDHMRRHHVRWAVDERVPEPHPLYPHSPVTPPLCTCARCAI
jgi:hypothetical protein